MPGIFIYSIYVVQAFSSKIMEKTLFSNVRMFQKNSVVVEFTTVLGCLSKFSVKLRLFSALNRDCLSYFTAGVLIRLRTVS